MKNNVAVLLTLFNTGVVFGQQRKPLASIVDSMNVEYPGLMDIYGFNKTLIPSLKKQIIYTLSYFPEFSHTKINYKLKKSRTGIISTRPTVGAIFRRASRRRYIVLIADSTERRGSFPIFTHAGSDAQVGILGHEQCHILYFSQHSGLGLIRLAIGHLSRRFMDRFENKTDSMDVVRGLGYQRIKWDLYLFRKFRGPDPRLPDESDRPVKRERYMSPASIRRVMRNTPLYDLP